MADTPKFKPMPGATGFIHHVDEAPAYWMQGILWTMLADAADTGGRWSMMEQLLPKGSGPPPHKHLWSDETFYILDGTITFLLENEIDRDQGRVHQRRAQHPPRLPGRQRDRALPQRLHARQHGGAGGRTRPAHRSADAAAARTRCDRRFDAR